MQSFFGFLRNTRLVVDGTRMAGGRPAFQQLATDVKGGSDGRNAGHPQIQ
jgi:hypothetical protein